ncbi:FtsX-like permease family protein [Candidatus Saccharibacteria bacterium]|nr:FtsX-like permease family protein [Candidatus Saccharibacteria bacterium]
MEILNIALANLRRKPARTAVIFFGIAALAGLLVSLSLIYSSVNNSIKIGGSRLGADAMAVPGEWEDETMGVLLSGGPTEFYMDGNVEDKIRAVKGVRDTSVQLFVISAPLSCCTVSDTMLVGVEPDTDFTISPWLRNSLGRHLSDGEVIVGRNILAEPGGKIKFYGREFLIAGKLDPTGMKYIDSSVFVPMRGVRDMISGSSQKALKTLNIGDDKISSVMMRFESDAKPEEVALRIEHAVPGVEVVLSSAVLRSAKENLAMPLKAISVAVAIQWAVSLLLIGVLYSLSISERERDVGILRASGARPRDIFKLFIYEILILSGAGGIAGIIAGVAFVWSFENLLRIAFKVPFLYPGLNDIAGISLFALGLSLLTGVLATIRPILRITRKPPYIAMRAEG